jgi:uncharacterized protein (TIGR02147 family)
MNKKPHTVMTASPSPSLFEYWDYRDYLRDYFAREKARDRKFSHRYVNGRLQVKSSSFFLQVVQGKSNISPEIRARLAGLLGLSGAEADYFRALVQYNQAGTHLERKRCYAELLALRPSGLRTLAKDQFAYLDKWYHVAVRQALAFHRVKDDFKSLAKALVPPILPGLLEKLGLAMRDGDGYFRWAEPSVTTGEDRKAPGSGDFLLQTMELAKGALDMPKPTRHLSTMTLTLSPQGYREAEEMLMRLRRELYDLAERDRGVDRVYHLNLHCFPMSKPAKERKR